LITKFVLEAACGRAGGGAEPGDRSHHAEVHKHLVVAAVGATGDRPPRASVGNLRAPKNHVQQLGEAE